ncbi:FabD/lysophospholipase-like protein [Zopfia rhizophila CBS 207.26]|uniref:FabD/lysophospholipase-like protein n=1 Tax=Zopfia rhizophila CBS 207.26 TaxID=1314779 RepID=A0A6A6DFZ7_9PEZI|nr:FabD/lysophospholipase-like protein [Zopfia rhizophila CBS 207.26]
MLPCKHGICNTCLVVIGERDPNVDSRLIVVPSCSLHHPPREFEPPLEFLKLPYHIGRRILSLDGGGVRGIVELSILTAIEKELGGDIPVRCFFDLIGGTSTGGLLAIGLGIGNWTLGESKDRLTDLMSRIFTSKSEWQPVQMWKEIWMGGTYSPRAFEEAVNAAFGDLSKQRMIGSRARGSPAAATKVFVTATIGNNKQGIVITNYAQQLEKDQANKDFTIREAALATCAAPIYFPPLLRHSTEYWDGGISFNNPSMAAASEGEHIWPSTKQTVPDLLLSIGNGWSTVKMASPRKPTNPIASKITALQKCLYQQMESEEVWDKSFGNMQNLHPRQYVRLNPKVSDGLPQIDDLQALKNGSLENIASRYLQEENTRRRITDVCRVLVATSFYFDITQRPYRNESGQFIIRGEIFCRFSNGSSTCKGLGQIIRRLHNPRIELTTPGRGAGILKTL